MSDISLGKLVLEADTKGIDEMKEKMEGLKQGVPSVGSMIDGFISKLKNIPGPAGVAAVAFTAVGAATYELIAHTMEAEEALLSAAITMGTTVEQAQKLQIAFQMGGVGADQLTGMTSKLAKAMEAAASDPFSKAGIALQKFGVSQEEIRKGDISEVLQKIGSNIGQFNNDASLSAAAMTLLGKSGAGAKEALGELPENMKAAQEAIAAYGTAVTKADAEASKKFLDTLSLTGTMFDKVGLDVTKSLTPALQELVEQFAESGKEGGFMRDMLDGLGATLSVIAKLLITAIVEPVREIVTEFKMAGTAIGGFAAAASAVAHGHLTDAGTIITQLGTDLDGMRAESNKASETFMSKLWGEGTDNIKKLGDAADDAGKKGGKSFGDLTSHVKYLLELTMNLGDAADAYAASTKSIDAYNKALHNQKIAQSLLKENINPNSDDGKAAAEQIRLTTELVQKTKEEVQAKTTLQSLDQQLLAIQHDKSELEKITYEITIGSLKNITDQEKEELKIKAAAIDQEKRSQDLTKMSGEIAGKLTQMRTQEIDSLAMTNKQLQRKVELERIDLEIAKIRASTLPKTDQDNKVSLLEQQKTSIIAMRTELDTTTNSWDGFAMGAQKALATSMEGAQNLNEQGFTMMNNAINGMTDNLVNMMNTGKASFRDLALSVVVEIEKMIVKMLIMKAIEATMSFLSGGGVIPSGGTGAGMGADMGSGATMNAARGTTFRYAASGIVNSATMVGPNTIAGEQGNSTGEAVLPLARNAQGDLGVRVAGSNRGSGGANIVQSFQINVDAKGNNDPAAIGRQVAEQVKQITNIANAEIARNLMPGGLLNRHALA